MEENIEKSENIENKKVKKIYFNVLSNNSWLSLGSFHNIEEDGILYKSCEHYYQYKKAMYFEDHDAGNKILKSDTYKGAIKESNNIKNYDEEKWNLLKKSVIEHIIRLKIEQNPELIERLMKTNDFLIIETQPEDLTRKIQGIRLLNMNIPVKENIIGNIWMNI